MDQERALPEQVQQHQQPLEEGRQKAEGIEGIEGVEVEGGGVREESVGTTTAGVEGSNTPGVAVNDF